jgi:hypothetical protein
LTHLGNRLCIAAVETNVDFCGGLEQISTKIKLVNVSYFAQTPVRAKDLLALRPATRATRVCSVHARSSALLA